MRSIPTLLFQFVCSGAAAFAIVGCGSSSSSGSAAGDAGDADPSEDGGASTTKKGDGGTTKPVDGGRADAKSSRDGSAASEAGTLDSGTSDGRTPDSGPDSGPPPNSYNLGMNLSSNNYYNNNAMYADITNQMSGNDSRWDTTGTDGVAAIDATGSPTVPAWAGWTADYPSGDYTVTWDGTGSLDFTAGGTLGAVETTTSGGVQHNTATLSVVRNPTLMSAPGAANWNYLTATPPITNFHVEAPAALRSASGLYLQSFLDRLQPFSTLRFMDALQTNGNLVENWSQRTWPSAGSRGGTIQGMAYEDIVDLANTTGKDIWINVPTWSTDDYVCRLARLLRYGEPGDMSNAACSLTAPSAAPAGAVPLNSKSRVYVEYSNEVWNWAFQQTADLYCMANGAPASGHTCTATAPVSAVAKTALADTSIPWDTTNTYYRGDEMGLILAKRNHDVFKTVFGANASQIHIVFNVQSAYAAEIDPGFTFLKAAYGSVTGTIDEMAVAPYFNIEGDTAASGAGCFDCSVDAIFADFTSTILNASATSNGSSIVSWLTGDVAEANKFGLPIIAYEGGQGLSGTSANLVTAQFDPRMYAATLAYFELWDQLIGRDHLFNYYSMAGSYGSFGSWGSLLDLHDPGSQKWDAMMSLTRLPGDANLDGLVDATDCTIVKANFNQTGTWWWTQGDFNHDNKVDADDVALLNAHLVGTPCAP